MLCVETERRCEARLNRPCVGGSFRSRGCIRPRAGQHTRRREGKIISLHFTDLNKKNHDVPWGTGQCDAADILAELKRQGFEGVIAMEYESHWEKEDLAQSVKFFREQCEKLAAEKNTRPGSYE